MPCYDSRDDRGGGSSAELAATRRHVNELETMLCGICRRADALPTSANVDLIGADPTLATWWQHHKAIDGRRAAKEAARKERDKLAKSAKAKLSPAEREALGIRD